jgi:hypothetical protein
VSSLAVAPDIGSGTSRTIAAAVGDMLQIFARREPGAHCALP